METKRLLDVLDRRLAESEYVAGADYTIADIANWPWYGGLARANSYGAAEFLSVKDYKNVLRWADAIAARPAVKRGRIVNKTNGDLASQLHERHDASDFDLKTQDKLAPRPPRRLTLLSKRRATARCCPAKAEARGRQRRAPSTMRGLSWLRKKEVVHSDRRFNRRLRASLVCEPAHRRRESRRDQCRREGGLPHSDLPRLHRDRLLPAGGSRHQRCHRQRVLGRTAGDRRRSRWHGPIGRHPHTARNTPIG